MKPSLANRQRGHTLEKKGVLYQVIPDKCDSTQPPTFRQRSIALAVRSRGRGPHLRDTHPAATNRAS